MIFFLLSREWSQSIETDFQLVDKRFPIRLNYVLDWLRIHELEEVLRQIEELDIFRTWCNRELI